MGKHNSRTSIKNFTARAKVQSERFFHNSPPSRNNIPQMIIHCKQKHAEIIKRNSVQLFVRAHDDFDVKCEDHGRE